MSNIFTITVIDDGGDACFGFYHTLEEAKKAIKENITDMHECLYGFIVIEEKPSGIRASTVNEYWYKYDGCTCNGVTVNCNGKWVACDKPERLKGIVSFSMG